MISAIFAREILDSKGDPTVEVSLSLSDGSTAIDSVPSGASTGANEAFELHDNDPNWYGGKGVKKAVENINKIISNSILNKEFFTQRDLDNALISLDGTPNKQNLGANAILAVSLTFARSTAISIKKPLYRYLGDIIGNSTFKLPTPLVLLLEGGKHGNWSTDIQEYMVLPKPVFSSFSTCLEACEDVYLALEKILKEKNYSTGVGFEGAFCPPEISSNEEALDLICQAIIKAGYTYPNQFVIALDLAASEFFQDNQYLLRSENNATYQSDQWQEKILNWTQKYPLYSLEDAFDQNQWDNWSKLNSLIGHDHLIVGDDLTTTNTSRIKTAIDQKAINSTLIKLNQIGTVSETLDAISLTLSAGFTSIVSHRGGETNDDFVADLVVGSGSTICKFGGPSRGERIAKYNRLLSIETELSQS